MDKFSTDVFANIIANLIAAAIVYTLGVAVGLFPANGFLMIAGVFVSLYWVVGKLLNRKEKWRKRRWVFYFHLVSYFVGLVLLAGLIGRGYVIVRFDSVGASLGSLFLLLIVAAVSLAYLAELRKVWHLTYSNRARRAEARMNYLARRRKRGGMTRSLGRPVSRSELAHRRVARVRPRVTPRRRLQSECSAPLPSRRPRRRRERPCRLRIREPWEYEHEARMAAGRRSP